MTVFVVTCGEYEQHGMCGIYESLDAAKASYPSIPWEFLDGRWCAPNHDNFEISEEPVQAMPQPSVCRSEIAIAREELGLPELMFASSQGDGAGE